MARGSLASRDQDITFVAGDVRWQRELRRRQSAWREAQGYPIGLHKGRPLGSRLAMPDAETNLWNFVTPGIRDLVRREYAANQGAVTNRKLMQAPRLFDDLLSSQPLVFNLFGELTLDLDRATVAARRLWPDRVDTVTGIEFEWSPGRGDATYLNNGTAADVAFFHTIPQGGRGLIFVETKYHEDLRVKNNAVNARHIDVAAMSRAFRPEALPILRTGKLQQLWFDHLLVHATLQAHRLDGALFVVVYPEINERCRDAIAQYRLTLEPSAASTFDSRTLEEVVPAVEEAVGGGWGAAFRGRYLTPTR